MLALQRRCVDDRLGSLAVLRDELIKPLDDAARDAAVVAAASLPGFDACADVAALAQRAPSAAPAIELATADRLDELAEARAGDRQLIEHRVPRGRGEAPLIAALVDRAAAQRLGRGVGRGSEELVGARERCKIVGDRAVRRGIAASVRGRRACPKQMATPGALTSDSCRELAAKTAAPIRHPALDPNDGQRLRGGSLGE